jgi:hypothetical protein
MRLKGYAVQIIGRLDLKPAWEYELAVLLASVGFIAVPTETIEKHLAGEALADRERQMILSVPQTAGMLLVTIPRLAQVASMITQRDAVYDRPLDFASQAPLERVRIGASLLKVLTDFDILLNQGHEPAEAIRRLAGHPERYDATLLDLLAVIELPRLTRFARSVPIGELRRGMIIDEDVRNVRGILVVPRGFEVNEMTCGRLQNFLSRREGAQTVRVLIPGYPE